MSILKSGGQRSCSGDIRCLAAFVTAAEHYDQRSASLNVVHAPARPEELAHFVDAIAHRCNVAEQAALGLALGTPAARSRNDC